MIRHARIALPGLLAVCLLFACGDSPPAQTPAAQADAGIAPASSPPGDPIENGTGVFPRRGESEPVGDRRIEETGVYPNEDANPAPPANRSTATGSLVNGQRVERRSMLRPDEPCKLTDC